MSRSARDATRFTQNIAQTYARSSQSGGSAKVSRSSSSTPTFQPSSSVFTPNSKAPRPNGNLNSSGNAVRAETPQEKVARLRAQHLQQKAAQLTTWDRLVLRSRNFADAAHRWTIFGIISFSALAGALTIYSGIDMLLYNRRKKREFAERYQQLWQERHDLAAAAAATGTATQTQLAIVKQEGEAQEFYQRREEQGIWSKVKSAFSFNGLSSDAAGTQSYLEDGENSKHSAQSTLQQAEGAVDAVVDAVEAHRREGEKQLAQTGYQGGPLDHMAANTAAAAAAATPKTQGSSWFSWGGKADKS